MFFCCRWIDQFLNANEEFLGLYCVGCTEASVIFRVVKDVTRMNVSFKKLRGSVMMELLLCLAFDLVLLHVHCKKSQELCTLTVVAIL